MRCGGSIPERVFLMVERHAQQHRRTRSRRWPARSGNRLRRDFRPMPPHTPRGAVIEGRRCGARGGADWIATIGGGSVKTREGGCDVDSERHPHTRRRSIVCARSRGRTATRSRRPATGCGGGQDHGADDVVGREFKAPFPASPRTAAGSQELFESQIHPAHRDPRSGRHLHTPEWMWLSKGFARSNHCARASAPARPTSLPDAQPDGLASLPGPPASSHPSDPRRSIARCVRGCPMGTARRRRADEGQHGIGYVSAPSFSTSRTAYSCIMLPAVIDGTRRSTPRARRWSRPRWGIPARTPVMCRCVHRRASAGAQPRGP